MAGTGIPNRIRELDGLRGIAILLVIAYHYLEPFHRGATGWRFFALAPARMGWVGVDLFFVLSGFLIGSILLANREAPAYFSAFYIRRFCRILPLYVPVVLLFFYWHQRSAATPQPPLMQYLTFTQNFWFASKGSFGNGLLAMTWSLAIEEQFYLLLPALVRFNPGKRFAVIVIACIALGPMLRYAFLFVAGRSAFFTILVLLPTALDPLMLGVLAAWLYSRGVTIPRTALWIGWAGSGAWLAMAALASPAAAPVENLVMDALYRSIIAMFSVTTLLLAIGGSFRFLRWKGLAYTGLISYGLYLLHQPVQFLFYRFAPNLGVARPVVSFIAAFIVAALSWELYEKWFVRYGHRFVYDPAPEARLRA